MKDKQEDGGFSLVVLAVAVLLYIAVLCMTFAGLVVNKPTVGAAFLEFTKDYGSLLAGIPVLVAVIVAKQQLDANRRQHVATVKRSLKQEIEALQTANTFCQAIIKIRIEDISKPADPVNIILDYNRVRYAFDEKLINSLMSTQHYINNATSNLEGLQSNKQELLTQAQEEAKNAISLIAEFESNLSQYWS